MKTCLPCHVVLVLVLLVASSPATAQQFLHYSAEGWNFGHRDQIEEATHVIKVTNRGPRAVTINRVELTCGCVKASFGRKVIAPGETVPLNLRLFANRGEGEIKKYVIVHSNDPGAPVKKLVMTGFIQPIWSLDVKGRLLDFGDIRNGEPTTRRVTLRVRPGFKVKLVDVLYQPTGGLVDVKTSPFREKDGHYGWYLDVTLKEKVGNGDFEGIVRVETDFAKFPFRGFRLKARVRTTTEVSPGVVRCGVLKPGEVWKGTVTLHKTVGEGLRVAAVDCGDSRMKVKSQVVRKGKTWRLLLTLTPRPGDREVRGTIRVTVDEPGWHLFEIKYRARIKGS